MPFAVPKAVSLSFTDDVWRATIGDHAANASNPFDAIVLVAHRAREAGFAFDPPAPFAPPSPIVSSQVWPGTHSDVHLSIVPEKPTDETVNQ